MSYKNSRFTFCWQSYVDLKADFGFGLTSLEKKLNFNINNNLVKCSDTKLLSMKNDFLKNGHKHQ